MCLTHFYALKIFYSFNKWELGLRALPLLCIWGINSFNECEVAILRLSFFSLLSRATFSGGATRFHLGYSVVLKSVLAAQFSAWMSIFRKGGGDLDIAAKAAMLTLLTPILIDLASLYPHSLA